MDISKSLKKNWVGEALFLSLFWFPPLGVLSLYYAFQAQKSLKAGKHHQAKLYSESIPALIENGIIGGIGLLTILAAYVFIKGGDLIPALSAFY